MIRDMKKALLLIDHGSRFDAANSMLEDVAAMLRLLRPQLHISFAHMELARPTIQDGVDACIEAGARHIIAHPYMLAPGRHATKDIPEMVKDAVAKYQGIELTVTEPLGVDTLIGEVILKRANL